jgi:hypothetical protein
MRLPLLPRPAVSTPARGDVFPLVSQPHHGPGRWKGQTMAAGVPVIGRLSPRLDTRIAIS